MIDIYNSLTEHVVSIDKLDANNDEHFDTLSDWCDENLEENGFYELDVFDDRFIIQIDDDNEDWLENFNIVVEKVKSH